MELAHLRDEGFVDPDGHGPQGLNGSGNTLKRHGPEKLHVGEFRGTRARRSRARGRVRHAVRNAQGKAGSARLPEPPDGHKGPVHMAGCTIPLGMAVRMENIPEILMMEEVSTCREDL